MSGFRGDASVRLSFAFLVAAAIAPWPAQAQVACQSGDNAQACVNPDGTTIGFVRTNANGAGVTNSGTVGTYIWTSSANSGVTNSGTVGTVIETDGDNSGVTNSGTVGAYILTFGANSGVTNSGTVGEWIYTDGDNSGVTNSGAVGTHIWTHGDNSGVTNSGDVGVWIQTNGDNSGVTNSGDVGGFIRTHGANSGVTNSGFVGSGAAGDGIFLTGLNPNLTLLPGSVIRGRIDLSGSGTRTLNIGNGLSVALTFDTPPDVINTFGAPYVQSGNQVAVVDATALSQHDEMLADLTSGIFNSVHARLGGIGGPSANGFGGMQLGMNGMMQLGGGTMMHLGSADIGPSSSRAAAPSRGGLWAQAFGGRRNADAGNGTTGSGTTYVGGIAGIDGRLQPGVIIGAFGGASQADLEVDFNSQKMDADSYFGGGYVSLQRRGMFAHLMVTGGQTDYDSTRRVANNLAPTGIEIARASFDGSFVSPELTIGSQFTFAGLTVEPSARGRYAYLSLDGYTETGAADGFSVGDRDVSLWLGRLQLAFPVEVDGARFAPRIGVEAWTSDSDRISAELLGQAISFSPGGDDNAVTGFVGATATVSLGAGAAAYLDGEVHFGDDGVARSEAHGGIKISF